MPGEAPSSGLRRTGVLATGAPRRVAARGACDALRRTPAEVFLVRRVVAVVLLERLRVFPATAFCVVLTSLVAGSRKHPKNNAPRGVAARMRLFCSFFNYIAHFSSKSKPYGAGKARFRAFQHYTPS